MYRDLFYLAQVPPNRLPPLLIMATTLPAHPTPQTVSQLLSKITDADPDFRFMALSDLLAVFNIAKPEFLNHDYNTAARTVDHVVRALDDQNGEVQNQAIKV